MGRSATVYTIHQLTQPVTHVAADGLSAKQRLRLFQDGGAANGSSGSWIGGIYEETAVFEDGEWKLARQDLHHLFNASYRNGWARVGGVTKLKSQGDRPSAAAPVAAAAPRPATAAAPPGRDVPGGGLTQGIGGMTSFDTKAFPPDRQIRARQYAFPDIVDVGFHYANPVSGREPKVWVNTEVDKP
ncbi:MAG: nuclear transport factor 2 family protein [Pseudomonadota bacterium]